jgi:hypothetical protein
MERYRLDFQDNVFFERYGELSDKQIRFYLDLRRAAVVGSDPQVRHDTQEMVRAGKGTIPIEEADLVMDFEMLCERGFIRRTPSGGGAILPLET